MANSCFCFVLCLNQAQSVSPADEAALQTLQTELQETRARLAEAESRLQVSEAQLQQAASSQQQDAALASDENLQAVMAEKDSLVHQLESARDEKLRGDAEWQKQNEQLSQEVASLRSQVSEGKSQFEASVQTYMEQIRGVTEEKQRLETEVEMLRRKFELSSVQQQEQINAELQVCVCVCVCDCVHWACTYITFIVNLLSIFCAICNYTFCVQ